MILGTLNIRKTKGNAPFASPNPPPTCGSNAQLVVVQKPGDGPTASRILGFGLIETEWTRPLSSTPNPSEAAIGSERYKLRAQDLRADLDQKLSTRNLRKLKHWEVTSFVSRWHQLDIKFDLSSAFFYTSSLQRFLTRNTTTLCVHQSKTS